LTSYVFMSPEHVAALNERLAASQDARDACARLSSDVLIVQHLTDEDGGPDVWWQVRFSREEGSSLRLGKPEREPDVLYQGGYWAMIAYMTARDFSAPPPLTRTGDASVEAGASEAHKASQACAIREVTFPVRGDAG